jgi:predicted aldo/keto reductase-like oxidoreductase
MKNARERGNQLRAACGEPWTGCALAYAEGGSFMELRRLGRIEHLDSVLTYGGAALGDVTQDVADESIAFALQSGINHFDTAPSYGESELRLGPWMPRIRDQIFLSTKTGQRDRDGAWREINRSLERLQTDQIDLIQHHAVGDLEQLDLITRPGGALEATIEAKEQGLVRAIGITGHGHQAPQTHLQALKRFPFETVLTPLNYVLMQNEAYRLDLQALVSEIKRQDAGLMVIKAIAHRPWPDGAPRTYDTWYEPFDHQAIIDAAIAYVLAFPEVTGLATAGDIHLLPMIVEAEERASSMIPERVEQILAGAVDYVSPFAAGGP